MEEVRETLDRLNAAWRERRFDDLNQYLDEHVVMKGPGFKTMARGWHKTQSEDCPFGIRSSNIKRLVLVLTFYSNYAILLSVNKRFPFAIVTFPAGSVNPSRQQTLNRL